MKKFKITVDGEDYSIDQHIEYKGLFTVNHYSGFYRLARRSDGVWSLIDRCPLAADTNLKNISDEMEKHL